MRKQICTLICLLAWPNIGCVVEQRPTDTLQQTVDDCCQSYRQLLADAHAEQALFLQSEGATALSAADDQREIRERTAAARSAAFAPLAELVEQRIGGSSYSRQKSARLNSELSQAFRRSK